MNSVTSASSALAGQHVITFTDVITNTGAAGVTGATVNVPIPTNLTGVTSNNIESGGATIAASTGTSGAILDTVNLPAGSAITYIISGTIAHAATGTLTDTSNAATPSGVPNLDASAGKTITNVSNDGVSLTPQSDLYVSLQGADPVEIGGIDIYTIVVTNNGPSAVTGVTLADTFSNLTGISYTSTALYEPTGHSVPTASSASGSLAGTGPTLIDSLNLSSGSIIKFTITGTIALGHARHAQRHGGGC